MTVGITSRIELGVRTAVRFGDAAQRAIGADYFGRLFDQQTIDEGTTTVAQPELRLRGASVRAPVVEVALGVGYTITPAVDLKASITFPEIDDEPRYFGAGVGVQIRRD